MSLRVRLARGPMKMVRAVPFKCGALLAVYVLVCIFLYWLYGGIFAFLIVTFATAGLLYRAEDKLVYQPESPEHSRAYVYPPSMFYLPYENVCLRSGDGTMLHMFFIARPEQETKNSPTLLYLHGNGGNMGHRLGNVAELYHNVKCNILMLEYRGYGLSQGAPSEEGLYMDARAGIDYLFNRSDINTKEIIVFGRSLGGAVAIDLATKEDNKKKIWCLILENTFTSIPDMASRLIGWKILEYLPLIFYKNKYMSLTKIRSITVPTLFVSGLADTMVPPRMMSDLFDRCPSPWKRMLPIPGGTHNETWIEPGYYKNIANFLSELRDNPQSGHTSSQWQIDVI